MGYKTDKERYTQKEHCIGNENKPNGSMENRAEI